MISKIYASNREETHDSNNLIKIFLSIRGIKLREENYQAFIKNDSSRLEATHHDGNSQGASNREEEFLGQYFDNFSSRYEAFNEEFLLIRKF